jgi:hypothetical protein
MEELAAAAGVAPRTLYRQFGSRQALLREAGCAAPPTARELFLKAALEFVGSHGLAELSMDELAAVAGDAVPAVSRQVRPLRRPAPCLLPVGEPVAEAIEAMLDAPPEEVLPAVARWRTRWRDGPDCCSESCSSSSRATRTPWRACGTAGCPAPPASW